MAKAHPCYGGPLDGMNATDGDFHGYYEKVPGTKRNDYSKPIEGMYEHLSDDYVPFNIAHRAWLRGATPNVVYMHRSILRDSVVPSKR